MASPQIQRPLVVLEGQRLGGHLSLKPAEPATWCGVPPRHAV